MFPPGSEFWTPLNSEQPALISLDSQIKLTPVHLHRKHIAEFEYCERRYFRGFMKLGNFACIKICVLGIIGSLGYHKCNFQGVHNFADI